MKIRLGTRKSPLAMWQAHQAANHLAAHGFAPEIIPISSEGDEQLTQPIYALGITGVFTKTLDLALLNDKIDVAVHSLKDVPTQLAQGLQLTACLPRGNAHDILVYKSEAIFQKSKRTLATGSLRRRAFWWNQYPQDEVVDLRGNVQLRLQKLIDNEWDAAVFAYAGLERAGILQNLAETHGLQYQILSDMISAPSQGIVGLVSRDDLDLTSFTHEISHTEANIERAFLRKLQGGCTAPIGAKATMISATKVDFKGAVLSLDGKQKITIEEQLELSDNAVSLGVKMAEECIAQGAGQLILEIKKQLGT